MSMKNSTRSLARYETAIDVLNMMVAGLSADIAAEEAKGEPSQLLIAKMVNSQRVYRSEALSLNPDDNEAVEHVIKTYGPLQRGRKGQGTAGAAAAATKNGMAIGARAG